MECIWCNVDSGVGFEAFQISVSFNFWFCTCWVEFALLLFVVIDLFLLLRYVGGDVRCANLTVPVFFRDIAGTRVRSSHDCLFSDPQEQLERMNSMWCCHPGCTKGCCQCCGTPDRNKWLPVQLVVYKWVTDPIFDIIVTLLIGLNTLFLALDYHNMPSTLEEVSIVGSRR